MRAVRKLRQHCRKSPDFVTEKEFTVFPLHQECQEVRAADYQHRVVQDQVLLRAEARQTMDAVLRSDQADSREEAAAEDHLRQTRS